MNVGRVREKRSQESRNEKKWSGRKAEKEYGNVRKTWGQMMLNKKFEGKEGRGRTKNLESRGKKK